jgi:hypothetical protein
MNHIPSVQVSCFLCSSVVLNIFSICDNCIYDIKQVLLDWSGGTPKTRTVCFYLEIKIQIIIIPEHSSKKIHCTKKSLHCFNDNDVAKTTLLETGKTMTP